MISLYTLPGTIVGKTKKEEDVNWTIGIEQLMDNLKFDRRRFIKYYEKTNYDVFK